MPAGTSNYPTTLDTEVELLQAGNNLTTQLSDVLNIADSIVKVVSTDYWPNSGALVIDNEVIYYGSKTSTTFTGIVRAAEDTIEASHTTGTNVRQVIVAGYHNVLVTAIKNLEAKLGSGAGTPTVGKVLTGTASGSAWTDRTYTFSQISASASWSITHNLNCKPSVSVVDSADNIVYGDVAYDTLDPYNKLTITFSAPFSGKAYLN